MFELSARILLDAPEVDGLIVLGLHHTPALQEDFVERIASLVRQSTKPVVACDIGETEMAMFIRSRFEKLGIPAYSSPEDAARAMAALAYYGRYLRKVDCFSDYLDVFGKRHLVRR
jgi:acyl-CoA synthetase (NDP forming)